MSTGLAIIGCGARTPVGFDRRSSAAAVRAGISVIAEHPFLIDRFGEPMKVTRDAGLDPYQTGLERLLALATPAAREALGPLEGIPGTPKISVVVCVGEQRPGQDSRMGATLTDGLCDALTDSIRVEQQLNWMGGHAGGIVALETASHLLSNGDFDMVLVGGVDSYLCRDTLEWLDDNEQLHSDGSIYGFCPGEAAGFVLVSRVETAHRLGLTPLLTLVSAGSGIEKNLIKTEDICLGDGLSAAFHAAAESLPETERVDRIICDMNGERYRGNEYGFAVLKASRLFKDAAAFDTPADCWGDVGAASGPLYVSLVVAAEERGYAKGPLSLIWASSEGGRRAAAILRRWGE
ncbi:beta-ketoacyl synthase N-terminal-like domain-containing protein [Pseudomonas chlororaphis subsp. aurantiaca]|uniref:beta-ketoacyl synthase N-terminal-like domain-containing protein n=1 Tax=Pseudomonas chlororaphis TaxID=587753 RepID=UPI0027DC3C3D|nr:beta-ketoacyl synthase N-terminal-like domain-containing protein [Pseudomonas chlororaphis]WMJ02457.1 beta-ketoacyl synthase N-terminal-like domain-containing protein [Pseudomonas chlororaphis subsp. aurantiaca]